MVQLHMPRAGSWMRPIEVVASGPRMVGFSQDKLPCCPVLGWRCCSFTHGQQRAGFPLDCSFAKEWVRASKQEACLGLENREACP